MDSHCQREVVDKEFFFYWNMKIENAPRHQTVLLACGVSRKWLFAGLVTNTVSVISKHQDKQSFRHDSPIGLCGAANG